MGDGHEAGARVLSLSLERGSFLSTLLLILPPSMTWHSHKEFHQSQGVAGTTMNMIKKQIQNLNRPFFFLHVAAISCCSSGQNPLALKLTVGGDFVRPLANGLSSP